MAEKNSLWKNIRNKAKQNRESGATPKKPTTEMLRQERQINAEKYDKGGKKKSIPRLLPVNEQGLPYVNLKGVEITAPEMSFEERADKYLGYPMQRSSADARLLPAGEDELDNVRHPLAGLYTANAIKDKLDPYMPSVIATGAGFVGSTAAGIGHEIGTMFGDDTRPWSVKLREAGEDIFNNTVGVGLSTVPFMSDQQKKDAIIKASYNNMLPDGYGDGNMYFKAKGGPVGEDDKNKTTTAVRDNTNVTSKSLEEKMAGAVNSANVKAQEQKEKAALEQERVKLRKFLDGSTGSLQNWKDRENAMQKLLEIDNQLGTKSLEKEIKTLNKAGRIMLKGTKYLAPELAPVIDAAEIWGDIYQYSKDPSIQNATSLGLNGMSPIKVVTNAGNVYRPFSVLGDIYDVNNIINEKSEGGYMYPGGGYTLPSGLDPTKATRQDSLMLFNNALEKIKFYKGNPDYERIPLDRNLREPNSNISHTNFKDPIQRKAIIEDLKKHSSEYNKVTQERVKETIKAAADFNKPFTPLEIAKLKRQIGTDKFGKVPNTNLTSFGDILMGGLDDIYNPAAPPIYLHPNITPQGSESYDSNRFADMTDVPYYDPIAIAPFDKLTPEQKEKRVNKYGDTGVPKSYLESRKKDKNSTTTNTSVIDRTPVQVDKLESLKLKNLQTQETPLELSSKAPTKRKAAINRGANSGFDADGNPLVSEVNFGDGTGWHKVPYDTLNQYEEIKIRATGGYTNPYNQYQNDPYLQYADGGYTYGKGGRTWKNIGAGAFGVLEGLVDTTFGWIPGVDYATDQAYKGLQKIGKSTEDERREQDSIHGYGQTAGAVGSAILTSGATTGMAISEGAQGLGQGISKGNETSDVARGIGTGLNIAGTVVGTAYNVGDAGKAATEGFKLSKAGSEGIGKFAAAAPKSAAAIKAANDTTTAARLASTVDSAGNVIGSTETTIKGVDAAGNALSMKPGVLAPPPMPAAPSSVSSLAPNLPTAATTASASLPTSLPNTSDYSRLAKIKDVTSSLSALPKSQEPPPMAPPIAPTPLPKEQPQTNYNEFTINPPAVNTGFEAPDYDFSYNPTQLVFSQGGNITNNSLNLRNTMRYKRFAQGGTFDQYGINMIPDSAGLHHESAYGGVPIGPDALAEGGEIKMDIGNGSQYIVSDQVDGAETQKDFMFSKGGKYKELNRTLADGMKQDLNKYTFGSLATSDRVKGDLRRPNDSYAQSTVEQIKEKWQQKTEYARQRTQQDQAIAQAEEQKKMAEEQYIAAYGGRINPKKYPGLNMTKKARGGQVDYTNDMYSMYAGGGPMPSNLPQGFRGPSAQNRGGMYIYPDGGMMSPEQQMMQEQQMQQQAPQEEMQQQPNQEQMMQMVQQAAQMLEQGAQPEQVMQQLVQAGVPQDMAMQAVQMAMQEMQGQMQQQGQEQPMQGQEQMMPPQGMAHGGMMYAKGGNSTDEDPPVIRKQRPKYYDDTDEYMREKEIFNNKMSTYRGWNDFNTQMDKAIKSRNRPFNSHKSFVVYMNKVREEVGKNNQMYSNYSTPLKSQAVSYPIGQASNFFSWTAAEPIDEPTLRLQELAALKADLSNKDVPTINSELGTFTPSTHTPKKVHLQRTHDQYQGVLPEDNPVFNYDPGYRINMGDSSGWQNVPKGEYIDPVSKEVYPSQVHYLSANNDQYNIEVPSHINQWAKNWRGMPEERASGGMMPPQEGMASQVAQQLQQGAQPQQVLQKLVEQGMSQEQAMSMIQAIMSQLQNQMQQQPQQQQQMMPQEQMAPQQPMMARGGYFNGRKQYKNAGPVGLSPLADESTMSQVAGIGQAVVPALTSAFAFNKLSKRKLTPSLVPGVTIDYTPERVNMMEESRRNLASGLNAMKGVAPTSSSYMGNVRGTILDANKLSGEQISKSWQDQKNKQAEYDYGVGSANAGIKNKINESNEEMYQNAMQTGYEAAGQSVKNASAYYSDLENRNLQRWQAMNTSGEDWHWTDKGKVFRNKDGNWYDMYGKKIELGK